MKYRYWPVFVFVPLALAGMIRARASLADPMGGAAFYVDGLSGVVSEQGVTANGNVKLTVEVERGDVKYGDVQRVMVYLTEWAEVSDGTYLGMTVTFSGMLEPLEHPAMPGEYDEFRYLRSRKIDAKIFPDKIEITEAGSVSPYLRLLIFLRQTRDRLANVYDTALPPREAGIMKSVLLGDKSGLDEDTAELYRASGTYHLLCISGLHIGIFLIGLGSLFKLLINERYAWLAALLILILYALLTGASVSTVRATVMGAVLVLAKLIFRDYDLPSSTAFACVALLIYEPLYLYDAGFQLSFGAVFGIAFLTAPVERGLSRIMHGFPYKNALASGIAATLATYPVLMYHFQEISTYGVLANLFIIPTASLLVVSGLIVGLAGMFFIPAAMFLAGISYYLLMFYDIVCSFFNSLPFAQIQTGPPSLLICALVYAATGCFAMALSRFEVD
jgi:competence protein ComEC